MERKNIAVAETWDVSSIYATEEAFYEDLEKAKQLVAELATYKDILTRDADTLYSFLTTKDTANRYISKLYCYAQLQCDVEPTNQTYQTMMSTILSVLDTATVSLSFIDNALCDNEENVRLYLEEERFAIYRYTLANTLAYKPHILSSLEETLLAKAEAISDASSQVFKAMRLEYEAVLVDGKKETLTSATLPLFLKHSDEKVREQAYTHFFKEYQRFENVFANTLSGVMKKDAFYAEVRKFDSSLAASVFADEVPKELFFKVVSMANDTYRHLFHRYNAMKKEILQKETVYNYDLNIPLVKNIEKTYTIDDCFAIIMECLAPFGSEYLDVIQKARTERWIDFHPTKGKRAGAYSSGSYDTYPFILLNFVGDYNSLSTMMHELGHSVHSYFSNQNQPSVNAQYRIFVAEVASTVNEVLLINHMIQNAETKEEKAYFLYEHLESCVGLIFRQPMFADFEYKLHQMAEQKQPLSSKIITDMYAKLSAEYFGKDVTLAPLTGWSCYHVPHFYYNFYVYKYTLGMTAALAIINRILKGDTMQVENYLQFLKAGASMSPIALLEMAGINPLENALYDDAFHYFESIMKQFENIMK